MFDITNTKITVYDVDGTEICEDVHIKTTAAENEEEPVINIVSEVYNDIFANVEEERDISEAEIKDPVIHY